MIKLYVISTPLVLKVRLKLSYGRISEDTGKPTNGLKKRSRQRKQFMNPLMVRPWMGEVDLTLTREEEEEKGKEG